MTPNDIEVLLHYHTCREIHPRLDAPAVQDAIDVFEDNGILHKIPHSFGLWHTTKKGEALVKMLQSTPYPIERFINPLTNEIISGE